MHESRVPSVRTRGRPATTCLVASWGLDPSSSVRVSYHTEGGGELRSDQVADLLIEDLLVRPIDAVIEPHGQEVGRQSLQCERTADQLDLFVAIEIAAQVAIGIGDVL